MLGYVIALAMIINLIIAGFAGTFIPLTLNKLKIDLITILINLTIEEKIKENNNQTIKPAKIDPKYIGKKMSRNEPCFCGSGKKYKRCCGAL